MNPKIVVDHELFTTCRLCLEEKGKYQIVPVIQENIKFVFDIEVELNNGLPQLICVDCEKLLSNFVCIKQLFQEKQKRLQKRLLCETGTPEGSGTNKANPHKRERLSSHSNEEYSEAEQERVVVSSCGKNTKLIIKKNKKTHNKSWRSSFVKQFGCRLCSEKFKKKDEVESHIIKAHKRKITNTCFVRLEKFDDKPNLTGSSKFVVLNNNKIMRNKKHYHIVYSQKSNYHSDSSEDEVFVPNKKYKRRKLDSGSSVDTLLIDESETDIKPDIKTEEMNPPKVKIHGRKMSSASESNSQPLHTNNGQSDNVIDNLITVCYNNLLKKMDSTNIASKNASEKSQLRHKILSIGSKIINTNPINCIGILRYLECRNLEVDFVMNESNDNNYVRIRTKLKCKKEKYDKKMSNWKTLQNTSISEPTSDFFDVLNKAIATETVAENNTTDPVLQKRTDFFDVLNKAIATETVAENNTTDPVLQKPTLSGLLLNATPVPNPKKLPKKNEESSSGILKSVEIESTSRGDNISTTNQNVSCTTNSVKDTLPADSSKTTPSALPRLKFRPLHELMASRDQSKDSHFYSQPFHCYAGPAQPNRTAGTATGAPHVYTASYNPMNNGHTPAKYINITPVPTIRPLSQIGNTMSNGTGETNLIQKPEYMILHTPEFPNTTTSSPFTYFKNLLQVNNINLIESKAILTDDFRCLIKFKLCFQQENAPHVELCLSLFSNVKCFCIKVANYQGIDIDIRKMTANWQWEILKAFTGEIVPRLVNNARNSSLPMHESVQKFVCYLRSIQNINF